MYAGKVSRDESMAHNIQWILDHSPKDKIVVWAHNGHVKAGGEGYRSMGVALREVYGPQMLVFGFAFNQGSFQAVELQKSRHDWTVPPAPAGSLDATLAATGIPLLALDLRQIPKDGPVADWWRKPHQTRSIGAVYSDAQASNYLMNQTAPQSYDVLLFLDKTTAARGNNPAIPPVLPDREYHDTTAGVHFKLPEGWSMRQAFPFGDHETSVPLVVSDSPATSALWYKVLASARPADPLTDCKSKVQQRIGQGRADYRLRPDSFRAVTLGDRQFYVCTGDYTQDGRDMAEYFIRAYTDKVAVMFFGTVPAADLERFRPRFESLAANLNFH
jgi:hypothetical protein